MAEGTVLGLEAADLEECAVATEITVLEAIPGLAWEASLDISPKDHSSARKPPLDHGDPEAGQGPPGLTGEWCLGLPGVVGHRAPPPSAPTLTLQGPILLSGGSGGFQMMIGVIPLL